MASSYKATRICAVCARQQNITRRNFITSRQLQFEDIRTSSRLPRVATTTFWSSLLPKFLRRRSKDGLESAQPKVRRQWNPMTPFIFLAILVGSNAINLIALRNEMANFSRKTDAKLGLLRETLEKVKNGEIGAEEVKRVLGTGDPEKEAEWEEVMKEIEGTDQLEVGRRKWEAKEAERKAKAEALRKAKEERERQSASPVAPDENAGSVREGRPKFLM